MPLRGFLLLGYPALSVGYGVWEWLQKEAHLKKHSRIYVSVGLAIVILMVGWAFITFVPLKPINDQIAASRWLMTLT
jgi:hypothetical protein